MAPLVSVITPCYQQGHFLAEAIESVLGQSYPAVEMVVVNDGSYDNTAVVAAEYRGRIKYISQPNSGLPAARNTGIRAADGRYLLFLDADDLLHPDAISWLVDTCEGAPNRVVQMGFRSFSTDCGMGNDWVPTDERLLPQLLHRNSAPPLVFLVPKEEVVRLGGFEQAVPDLFGCEDWDLWVRLALEGIECRIVKRVGGYYRNYPGSMSTKLAKMEQGRIEVLARAAAQIRARPELLAKWGDHIDGMLHRIGCKSFDLGYMAAREGHGLTAVRWYLRSLKYGVSVRRVGGALVKLVAHVALYHFGWDLQNRNGPALSRSTTTCT